MNMTGHTRRDFSLRLMASLPALAMAESAYGLPSSQADCYGISHTCESIHQEVVFKATRRVSTKRLRMRRNLARLPISSSRVLQQRLAATWAVRSLSLEV